MLVNATTRNDDNNVNGNNQNIGKNSNDNNSCSNNKFRATQPPSSSRYMREVTDFHALVNASINIAYTIRVIRRFTCAPSGFLASVKEEEQHEVARDSTTRRL